ncbi:MAG: TIGR03546 family protein, partial [Treponema sp.]|nr:TIGR03546 family protein [Treponema sp.]
METSAIKTNIKEKKLSVFENFLHHISKNSNPFSVSHAICLGLLLGFMPKNNLLWYVLVVLFLFIRLNPFYYLISIIIGTLASPLLDNIFDSIGYKILTLPVLENFFSSLLDIPFVFFTKINNSIVAGSIVFSVICYVPIFFLVMIIKKQIDKFLAKRSEDGRNDFENAQTVNVQESNEQVVNKEVVNNIQMQNSTEHTLPLNQSNQSKKKKFFIRIVPLASVLCVILIFVLGVYLFKNLIAKRVIVSALQSIFQAKTDIEQTNLDLRNAKLSVKNLEQANKYNVMKNIFQIDSIVFDLNLRELSRGKFDAENVAFENVRFGTERKSSGYIPSIKSKEEQENKIFILNMQQNIASDVQKLLTETFSDYNPEHIITRVQTDLASPVVAESAKKIIEELIQKWKGSPENMQEKILAFSKSVEGLVATDWENIRDVSVLQKALKDTNDAITRGKSIKNETENIVSEFRKDTSQLAELSRNVANAI